MQINFVRPAFRTERLTAMKCSRFLGILIATCISAMAWAEETTLDCVTQRVWQRPGVPTVIIASFDEKSKTATLFASELGGRLVGEDVSIDADMIMFKLKTKDGEPGDVTVMRTDGTLMLNVKRSPEIKILASCRKQTKKF